MQQIDNAIQIAPQDPAVQQNLLQQKQALTEHLTQLAPVAQKNTDLANGYIQKINSAQEKINNLIGVPQQLPGEFVEGKVRDEDGTLREPTVTEKYLSGASKQLSLSSADIVEGLGGTIQAASRILTGNHIVGIENPFKDVADGLRENVSEAPNLPNTIAGRVVGAIAGIAPLITETALTGGILGAATFPSALAVNSFGKTYSQTQDLSKSALSGAGGALEGILWTGLGYGSEIGADLIAGTESGILHPITASILNGAAFGGGAALIKAIKGEPNTAKDFIADFSTGALLRAFTRSEVAKTEDTFHNTTNETIKEINELPQSITDLRNYGIKIGMELPDIKDPKQISQAILTQNAFNNMARIKSMTKVVTDNLDGYIQDVKNSKLSPEDKQARINKAQDVAIENNPATKEAQPLSDKVATNNQLINKITNDPALSAPDRQGRIEALTKQNEDLNNEIKKIYQQQRYNIDGKDYTRDELIAQISKDKFISDVAEGNVKVAIKNDDVLGKLLNDKITNFKTKQDAIEKGKQSENNKQEHPGTTSRESVRPNNEEVGQSESEQTGNSNSIIGEQKVKIITHPESVDTEKGIVNTNDSDNPELTNDRLTLQGREDASKIDLTAHDKIFVSPNERAKETLELAKKNPNATITETPLLKTGDVSELEKSPEHHFDEKQWIDSKDGKEFSQRMEQAWKLKEANPDAAFVTHSKVEKALNALDETNGVWNDKAKEEYLKEEKQQFANEKEAKRSELDHIAEHSKDPLEIIKAYHDAAPHTKKSYKEQIMDEHGIKVDRLSYSRFGDLNNVGNEMAKRFFVPKKGASTTIDVAAKELSETAGIEITPQDIVDFIEKPYERKTSPLQEKLANKFRELTGLPWSEKSQKKVIEDEAKKHELNLNKYYDKQHREYKSAQRDYERRIKSGEIPISDYEPIGNGDGSRERKEGATTEGQPTTNEEVANQLRGRIREAQTNSGVLKGEGKRDDRELENESGKVIEINEILKKRIDKSGIETLRKSIAKKFPDSELNDILKEVSKPSRDIYLDEQIPYYIENGITYSDVGKKLMEEGYLETRKDVMDYLESIGSLKSQGLFKQLSEKEQAIKELSEARSKFKKAIGASSGGLEALPEFVEVVKAAIKAGYYTAKEFIQNFGDDYKGKYSEKEIEDAFNKVKPQEEKALPSGKGQKGFIETVKDSPKTSEGLKKATKELDEFYDVFSNEKAIKSADRSINADPNAAKKDVLSDSPPSAQKSVKAIRLIKHYESIKDWDSATEIIDSYDKQLREAGRFIQAASLWNKLSPETMVRMADKQAEKAGKNLSPEAKKEILKRMSEIGGMKEGEEKDKATLEVLNYIADQLPPTFGELFEAYRYQNMLSNPRSHERNIYSNLFNTFITRPLDMVSQSGYDLLTNLNNPVARDMNIAGVKKYITTAFTNIPEAITGFSEAFKHGYISEKILEHGGVNESAIQTLRRSRQPKALTFVPRLMEAQDKFFSILIGNGEKARLIEKGLSEEEASSRAHKLAEKYLYRERLGSVKDGPYLVRALDHIGKMATDMRNGDNALSKAISWFVPFVTTPVNVVKQGLERSPLAFIGGKFDKEQIANATLGTIISGVGAIAAMQGRTTWSSPDDKKERELFYAAGMKPYSVKIGEKWIPVTYFGPYGFALALPAAAKYYSTETKEALTDPALDKIGKAAMGLSGYITSSTPLSGISGFAQALEGKGDFKLAQTLGFTSEQVIPLIGMVKFVNTILDPVYRKASGVMESIEKDLPGLSKGLGTYPTPSGVPATRETENYFLPYDVGLNDKYYEQSLSERRKHVQERAKNRSDSKSGISKSTLKTSELPVHK